MKRLVMGLVACWAYSGGLALAIPAQADAVREVPFEKAVAQAQSEVERAMEQKKWVALPQVAEAPKFGALDFFKKPISLKTFGTAKVAGRTVRIPVQRWADATVITNDEGGKQVAHSYQYPIFAQPAEIVKCGDGGLCWQVCHDVCDGYGACWLSCTYNCTSQGGSGDPRPK